jgi:hypothetical protein
MENVQEGHIWIWTNQGTVVDDAFWIHWQIEKMLESYLQGMARQIEAAFEECSEQIDQADSLKLTDWYFEFGFNGKEDLSTNREEWLTGGDWGQGQGQENYQFAGLG